MNSHARNLVFAFLFIALAGVITGCQSRPTGATFWNPFTWFSGSEGRKLERAQIERTDAREAVIKAAQKTAHETAGHLALAPASRPVELAAEANGVTVALLDQAAGPLTIEESNKIRAQVAALNSELATVRADAERQRAADRGHIADVSAQLGAANAKVTEAQRKIAEGFARENALANQLRNANLIKWGGIAWGILSTAAAVAYKLNLGGLQQGVGNAFGVLKARYGADDVDVKDAAHEIDALISPSQQKAVAGFSAAALAAALTQVKPTAN